MSAGRPPLDRTAALAGFCAALSQLRDEAGGPTVASLDRDITVPLRRAQIYATLNGEIRSPPAWEFVSAFVRRCLESAQRRGRLALVTDRDWEGDHRQLVALWCDGDADGPVRRTGRPLTVQRVIRYRVSGPRGAPPRQIGVVTGAYRQVHLANVWVNSENTEMHMARVEEFSISAVIRYEGARHDARHRVLDDIIFNELEAKVAGSRPVEPGTVVVTGAGELTRRNGVHHIIHVAAVQGEPGRGYQPARDLARCVDNVLRAAEELPVPDGRPITILIPLMGTGTAGADVDTTAVDLIHAATNYLRTTPTTRLETVLFQAYTDVDLRACRRALKSAGLSPLASGTGSAP